MHTFHAVRRRSSNGGRSAQRGNMLVIALLGLLITAIAAVGALQVRRAEQKRAAGMAEASVLEALRNGLNAAIFEQIIALQQGNPLVKSGVSVAPAVVSGELVWQPTTVQLAAMTYLPPGWAASESTVASAPYVMTFKRVPAGCVAASCGIEGYVAIAGAIRDAAGGGVMDGVTIGAILAKIGADAGVSLPTAANQITGFNETWSAPNPLPATAGVVAVRVGTASAGFSEFVRIADPRDPNLAGNLTVAKALNIGGNAQFAGNVGVAGTLGVTGATTLKADTTLANATLNVTRADGTNCVQLQPGGTITVSCDGALNARTAVVASDISAGGAIAAASLTTTGNVTAAGSLAGNRIRPTGSYVPGSACSATNEVAGNASGTGLVLCAAGAWRAIVTQAAAGEGCAPEGAIAQADGAGLLCRGGTYAPLATFLRRGTLGAACTEPAATAVDLASGATVICLRGAWRAVVPQANSGSMCTESGAIALDSGTGTAVLCRATQSGTAMWYRLLDLTSSLQWIASVEALDGQVIVKPSCGSSAGYTGTAALILTPMAEGSSDASFSRYAVDNGSSWTVFLRDSAGAVLQGTSASGSATVIAQSYCYYP